MVGGCFALGFGLTQRLASDQSLEPALEEVEPFALNSFPGQRLQQLRARHGDVRPLLADVATQEAELPTLRLPQPQLKSTASSGAVSDQQNPPPKVSGPGAAPIASVLDAPQASSLNAEALDAALDVLLGGPIAVQEAQQPDRPT